MKYCCDECNYETDYQTNLNRHNLTKKHLKNVAVGNIDDQQKTYDCDKCQKSFSTRQSLFAHRKLVTCIDSKDESLKLIEENYNLKIKIVEYEMKKEIEQLKDQMKDKEIEHLKETIKEQSKDKESFKKLAEGSVEVSNKSMSALNYAIKYYSNAPPMQIFNNFAIFLEGNEKYELDEIMIHYYEKDKLCSYIGDKLIKEYKKADPVTQSMWVGDVNRMSYILKENDNNKGKGKSSSWNKDKEGISMAKYMIEPTLEHIKSELINYKNELCPVIQEGEFSASHRNILMKKLESSVGIIDSINNNELTGNIIKYIAPHFYLNRNTKQETVNNDA